MERSRRTRTTDPAGFTGDGLRYPRKRSAAGAHTAGQNDGQFDRTAADSAVVGAFVDGDLKTRRSVNASYFERLAENGVRSHQIRCHSIVFWKLMH
ncbi:hypothetical protein C476_06462 [Natrinema limicola JCM 13563]|uniref:Uncharacterized protein n=1 Tax=Natrinema limicola JCM 13563 TaxID=1230457 RepID=M0CHG7_9EURY|nr:hypothetical protein C476_06462 [Natrinema limicola JCM 13563]